MTFYNRKNKNRKKDRKKAPWFPGTKIVWERYTTKKALLLTQVHSRPLWHYNQTIIGVIRNWKFEVTHNDETCKSLKFYA